MKGFKLEVCRICGRNRHLVDDGLCKHCNKSFNNGTIWILDTETMEWTKEERELKQIAPVCFNHKTPLVMLRRNSRSPKNKDPKFTSYRCIECRTEKELPRTELHNRRARVA